MPKVAPRKPVNRLLFLNGVIFAMMMKQPENIPAPPIPAIARPIINAMEVGAAPQMALPTSNMKIEDRNVHLVLSKV